MWNFEEEREEGLKERAKEDTDTTRPTELINLGPYSFTETEPQATKMHRMDLGSPHIGS